MQFSAETRKKQMQYRRRYHKKLENVIKEADVMRADNVHYCSNLDYEILKQKIETNDFLRTKELVHLSNFAQGPLIQQMYLYRLNGELDKVDIEAEVAKEYHVNSKYDNRLYRPVRKAKQNKIKKSHLI